MRLDGTAAKPIQRRRRAQVISSTSGPVRMILGIEDGAAVAGAAAAAAMTAGAPILARSRWPLCFLPPFLMPVAAGLGAELGSGALDTAVLGSGAVTCAAADTDAGSGTGAGAGAGSS